MVSLLHVLDDQLVSLTLSSVYLQLFLPRAAREFLSSGVRGNGLTFIVFHPLHLGSEGEHQCER